MKKLLLIGIVLVSVFGANALTLRQSAAYIKGLNPTTTDTATITASERIMALHVTMCSRASRDVAGYVMSSYTNNAQFTVEQFREFVVRGLNSSMQSIIMSQMLASSNVQTYGIATIDAQLEASYLNVMFGVIKLIGNGSL
jgi:hypothetical protein